MELLEYRDAHPGTNAPRLRAGQQAERQMAHYLGRAFKEAPDIVLLHGLRLVDDTRTDVSGGSVVAQIDHLVLHEFGAFIVESKSCSGDVRVSTGVSGGDEWSIRPVKASRYRGIPSPIQQAQRQGQVLRDLLIAHKAETMGKVLGFLQKGYSHMPIQLVVAISDSGVPDYKRGWKPAQTPFRTSVEKADNVSAFIDQEIRTHRKKNKLAVLDPKSDYGLWRMTRDELKRTGDLLAGLHTPLRAKQQSPAQATQPSSPEAPAPRATAEPRGAAPSCKQCGERTRLDPRSGRYGYYWHCEACDTNTSMNGPCSACGAKGKGKVRVSKRGGEYVRTCSSCGVDEVIWRERAGE